MKRVLSFVLVFVLLLAMVPVNALAEKVETTPMYRLYNPNSGEHFYTGSLEEKNNLVAAGWNYEGIAWNAPTKSGDPVHRLYNPNSGDHHYTMSAVERDMLVGYGWKYEGVCWNSVSPRDKSAVPLFRMYNPNADCGSHHYTTSAEERDNLVAVGWILEGIGWFGMGDHQHDYKSATCTEPKTCKVCGAETGEALGHQWINATCITAKVCFLCGKTEGSALGHSYQEGICSVCGLPDPDYVPEGFAPIIGIWTMQGLTDNKEELDKIRVIFAEGNVEFWVMYKGLIPKENLESALENGYADTEEGRFFYNDIEVYEGNYYYWVGYGGETRGTYTEEGNLVILTLEGWDEETEEMITSTLTFERISETTCKVKSIDGVIIDDIVTQAVKNGTDLTFLSLEEEY